MEGEAGAGQAPFGAVPGQAGDPGCLGRGQDDRGDRDGAGKAAGSGHDGGAGVYQQFSVGGAVVGVVGGGIGLRCREGAAVLVSAGDGVAAGDGADLGDGGQEGVAVQGVPGSGLGLVPAKGVLPRPESGFGRPAAARHK